MTESPHRLPPRALLYMFILFFVVPGLLCLGCIAATSFVPTPAERSAPR